MTVKEVRTLISDRFPTAKKTEIGRQISVEGAQGLKIEFAPYPYIVQLWVAGEAARSGGGTWCHTDLADGACDVVYVFLTSPLSGSRVFALGRSMKLEKNLTIEALTTSLTGKYGQPAWNEQNQLSWLFSRDMAMDTTCQPGDRWCRGVPDWARECISAIGSNTPDFWNPPNSVSALSEHDLKIGAVFTSQEDQLLRGKNPGSSHALDLPSEGRSKPKSECVLAMDINIQEDRRSTALAAGARIALTSLALEAEDRRLLLENLRRAWGETQSRQPTGKAPDL